MDDEELWFSSIELDGNPEHTQPIRKKEKKQSPKLSFSLNIQDELESYHHLQGTESSFCPYNNSMPSFKNMNKEQQDFYLFWRDQVKEDWYHFTDIGYIYVLTFEYLHGFGWDTPVEGGQKLLALWQAYGNLEDYLHQQYQDWVFDFFLLKNIPLTPYLDYCPPSALTPEQQNLCYHQYQHQSPFHLPFSLIVASYPHTNIWNSLYQNNLLEEVQQILEHTLQCCEAKLQRVRNKSLFQIYSSSKKISYSRFAYDKIPYVSKKPSFQLEVTDHLNFQALFLFLENFVNFTLYTLNDLWETDFPVHDGTLDNGLEEEIEAFLEENHPMPQTQYQSLPKQKIKDNGFTNLYFHHEDRQQALQTPSRGRFKAQEKKPLIDEKKLQKLREEAKNLEDTLDFSKLKEEVSTPSLDFSATAKEEPPKQKKEAPKPIALDFSQIDKLREESDAVREALATEDSETPPPVLEEDTTPITAEPPPPLPNTPLQSNSQNPLPPKLQVFWDATTPEQQQILQAISKQDWEALALLAQEQFSMVELLIDELNTLAMDTLGDILLESPTDSPEQAHFLEEYQEFTLFFS